MNKQAINRQQFLRGNFKAEQALRPPWALSERFFTDICTRCGDCINSCYLKLIQTGSGGFPEINFKHNGCNYCEACVNICKSQALQKTNRPAFSSNQNAIISAQCFAKNGIICRSCEEICEQQAIEFQLQVGGTAQLTLHSNLCNGCGECVHICPANAIQVKKTFVENSNE